MKKFKYPIILLILFIIASGSKVVFKNLIYTTKDISGFQKTLNKKIAFLDNYQLLNEDCFTAKEKKQFNKNGIIVLVYKYDSLIIWSDNTIDFPNTFDSTYFEKHLSLFSNSWFVTKTYEKDDLKIVGLILIKRIFPFINRYIETGYHESFKLPGTVDILLNPLDKKFAIYDWEGKVLFSLKFNNELKYPKLEKYFPAFMYFILIIFLLLYLNRIIKNIENIKSRNRIIILISVVLLLLRFLQINLQFPAALYSTEFFNPLFYASSKFIPSLGDLLLHSLILLFIIIKFVRDFSFQQISSSFKNSFPYPEVVIYSIVISLFIMLNQVIYQSLVLNSSISFEIYRVTSLTVYSFIGLTIILMLFSSLVLMLIKKVEIFRNTISQNNIIIIFTITYFSITLILFIAGLKVNIPSLLFFYIVYLIVIIYRYKKKENNTYYSGYVFVLFIFSIFLVYFLTKKTNDKDYEKMSLIAENLYSERDPLAEYFLESISNRIKNDEKFTKLALDRDVPLDQYLINNYFNGFWSKYELYVSDCLLPENFMSIDGINCWDYYDTIILQHCIRIPNTSFYYLNDHDGKVDYLGRLSYSNSEIKRLDIIIELQSGYSVNPDNVLGYPELLFDQKRINQWKKLDEYSYAKYYKGEIITQTGNYLYNSNDEEYTEFNDSDFQRFEAQKHLVYTPDNDNTIIISKTLPSFFDHIICFSYIFVFYYILAIVFILIFNVSHLNKAFEFNLKNKIQSSIVSILLFSFFLIGGGTIYFSINEYQKKNYDALQEKVQSVYIELVHKLENETLLTPNWSQDKYKNLDALLTKFSVVFFSDINLYDPAGNLLATSRPEIFISGLKGYKMHPDAFHSLAHENKAEFIHKINIGEMNYLSAYVPFYNKNNELLAYLNLPYFTKQDTLSKEISALVAAIVNIYVLLILLTIGVAVIISGTITKPLRLIQEKLGKINLLSKHELIQYKSNDEIGSLIKEYNKMVTELVRNAELLARSERESAWREMAKQIAHEIKNPLTPMKLNIQHLQRAKEDNAENYDKIHEKVTQSLIEQIEHLSQIASEFSNFSNMPKDNFQKVDLLDKIKNVISLFSHTTNVELMVHTKKNKKLYVYADKEQIMRVFINLIKNAIQSIAPNKEGKIKLIVYDEIKNIKIEVKDNGKGIADNLKEKLFEPNFTTKTSGMGMGLAIVKNIIINCKGEIDFHTEVGKGTTFTIKLPSYSDRDK